MKVLHILPVISGSYGGPVWAAIELCQELKKQGVEVAIAATYRGDSKNLDKIETVSNSTPTYYFKCQFSLFFPPAFSLSYGLERWLRQHIRDFDLLHIHCLFTYPSTVASSYAKKYRIPYILRPAGMLSDICLKKSAFKKKLYTLVFERTNLKNAAAIHFTSEEEMHEAKELKLNNQHVLIPNGLDLEKFNNSESLKGVFRKLYPGVKGKKIILFLSRIDPIKGLDLLIPALQILYSKRNDFIFVIAGSGSKNYEKWVRQALANAGLSEITVFTGFVENKIKFALLADANVFVLPSYHENFGMAVVEAMAAGLPVVISNQVNIYKLIEGYQAGIVTGLNSQEIAVALERLLSDESLQLKIGTNGKRLVEENFDIKKTAHQMIKIYSKVNRGYQ